MLCFVSDFMAPSTRSCAHRRRNEERGYGGKASRLPETRRPEAGQAKSSIAAIFVIPAKAGIQAFGCVPPIQMDSGLRRNDGAVETNGLCFLSDFSGAAARRPKTDQGEHLSEPRKARRVAQPPFLDEHGGYRIRVANSAP